MGMLEIGPRDEIKKLYNQPANRGLRCGAVLAISISIVLLLVMVIWMG